MDLKANGYDVIAIGKINDILTKSEETLNAIAASDVLVDSFYKGRKNSIAIYADLYDATRQVRPFAQVDLYMGSRCMYSTARCTRRYWRFTKPPF